MSREFYEWNETKTGLVHLCSEATRFRPITLQKLREREKHTTSKSVAQVNVEPQIDDVNWFCLLSAHSTYNFDF